MVKLKNLYFKYQEIINYLIIGVLTTLVSLLVYFICVHTFWNAENPIELQLANIFSWIISVTFAYVTNRIIVFKSKSKKIMKEVISFFSSRIVTLVMDMLIMYVLVTLLHQSDTLGKLISQIVVIVGNYLLSKIFVFKK